MRLWPFLLAASQKAPLIAGAAPPLSGPAHLPADAQAEVKQRPLMMAPSHAAVTAANKEGGFARDFERHPLKTHFPKQQAEQAYTLIPDVHAAFHRLVPLLLENGIVTERPGGPSAAPSCGQLPQQELGHFKWHNPYVWNYEQNVVISMGDRINKGPFNLKTLCFFADLQVQAAQAGGRVVLQWGNHEVQLGAEWDNVKSRGPGGLLWELWGFDIDPVQFFRPRGPFMRELSLAPIVTQLQDEIVIVHGGVCPEDSSMDQDLKAIRKDIARRGFQSRLLQREDSFTRCRLQQGHRGEVTAANVTWIFYAHDPEHAPRGLPYCTSFTAAKQKPFVYCRLDVGLTPYINYSLGYVVKIGRQHGLFTYQSCNELGACAPLAVMLPNASQGRDPAHENGPRDGRDAAPIRGQDNNPGRLPHGGAERDFQRSPAIADIVATNVDVFVVPDLLGAYVQTKKFLQASGLVAPGEPFAPSWWTGGKSVLVSPGNIFGAGYHNLETIDLFYNLSLQAEAVGGRVEVVLGAKEIDFFVNANNDETWSGGGIATQLVGKGLWPEDYVNSTDASLQWLRNRPFGARVLLDVYIGGQTSNRALRDLDADYVAAYRLEGYAAALISGPNSAAKKLDFAGQDGRQGPLLARDAGVTSIVHGHNFAMQPFDKIKPYGKKDHVFSLFNVATPLNPSLGAGGGEMLRIRPQNNALHYAAIDKGGKSRHLARQPHKLGRPLSAPSLP